MATLREKQKELTRQQLLEAALEVFSTKGYTSTSVEDLTTTAGASRATFYLHFTSKLDILVKASAVATTDIPELYTALDQALAEGSRPALEEALGGIIDWFESHSGLLLAWAEASMEDRTLVPRGSRLFDTFYEAMPYVRSMWPGSKEEQGKIRLHLFVLQLERFFQYFAVTGQWVFPRDVFIGVLADMWSVAFLPPAPTAKPARKRAAAKPRTVST